MSATLPRMETDEGIYRQELDAWKRATLPAETRQVYRCPWPRCPHLYHQRADLHVHIDVIHGRCAPARPAYRQRPHRPEGEVR